MNRRQIEIINKLGLHARAAAKLVSTAQGFESDVFVEKNDQRVNGKSIMGVMMLAAGKGSQVTLETSGSDEAVAMDALADLIGNRFGEAQ